MNVTVWILYANICANCTRELESNTNVVHISSSIPMQQPTIESHSTYGGGWKLKRFMYKQKMPKNDSTIAKCNCYNHENLHKKMPTTRNWQTIERKRETTSSRTQCVATNQRILLVRYTFFSSSVKTELKLNVKYSTGSHECNVTQLHSTRIDWRQNASDSCRVTSYE